MKKMNIAQVLTSCLVCCGIAAATTSCNDEWKDEQYEKYISFKFHLKGIIEVAKAENSHAVHVLL